MKKVKLIFSAALIILLSFSACGQNESANAEQTTAEPETTQETTVNDYDYDSDDLDKRILGDWSGKQCDLDGNELADIEIRYTDDGRFTYFANGDYDGDEVKVEQSGTYTIDVDVVTMTFKHSKVTNTKTKEVTEEDLEESTLSATLTSSTDLYIVSYAGYTIELKKQL